MRGEREASPSPLLTPREREIIALIAANRTARQAAVALGLAIGTVNYRLYRLRVRWRCPTNAGLVARAKDARLI